MRVDRVGVTNPQLIFDEKISEASGYPGEWWRKCVVSTADAALLVRSIELAIGN
jgi:hypothetical protein